MHLHVDSENSDQIGQMSRLICVFAGLTSFFFCFVVLRLRFYRSFSDAKTVTFQFSYTERQST